MGWIRQKNVFDAPHPHAPFHAFVSFEFPVQLQAQTFRIRCCWDSFRFAECSKPCCCWCLQINFSRLTVTTAYLRTVANIKLPGLFAVQLLLSVKLAEVARARASASSETASTAQFSVDLSLNPTNRHKNLIPSFASFNYRQFS